MEPKPDIVKESPVITPSYTSVALNVKPTKLAGVVRTLFTDGKLFLIYLVNA